MYRTVVSQQYISERIPIQGRGLVTLPQKEKGIAILKHRARIGLDTYEPSPRA